MLLLQEKGPQEHKTCVTALVPEDADQKKRKLNSVVVIIIATMNRGKRTNEKRFEEDIIAHTLPIDQFLSFLYKYNEELFNSFYRYIFVYCVFYLSICV